MAHHPSAGILSKAPVEGIQHGHHGLQNRIIASALVAHPAQNSFKAGGLRYRSLGHEAVRRKEYRPEQDEMEERLPEPDSNRVR